MSGIKLDNTVLPIKGLSYHTETKTTVGQSDTSKEPAHLTKLYELIQIVNQSQENKVHQTRLESLGHQIAQNQYNLDLDSLIDQILCEEGSTSRV